MNKTLVLNLNELNPYIRCAGFQDIDDWPNNQRKIYDHEMFYCINGHAHIKIDDRNYTIKPGTLVLIKPNTPTKFYYDTKLTGKLCWIHFDFLYFNDDTNIKNYLTEKSHLLYSKVLPDNKLIRPNLLLANGFTFPEYLKIKNTKIMEQLCSDIIYYYRSQNFLWELNCKINLLKIFSLILEQTYTNIQPTNKHHINVSQNVIQYIKYNYYHKINIEEIANYIGLSKDYINKIFRNHIGKTIIEYLTFYRIEKAKQLLLFSDLNIKDISEKVGFNDQYYFSKVMKKITGFSPLNFRKQYRQN